MVRLNPWNTEEKEQRKNTALIAVICYKAAMFRQVVFFISLVSLGSGVFSQAFAANESDKNLKGILSLSTQAKLLSTREIIEANHQLQIKNAQASEKENERIVKKAADGFLESLSAMAPKTRSEFIRAQIAILADLMDTIVGEGPHRSQTAALAATENAKETAEAFMGLVVYLSEKFEKQGSTDPAKKITRLKRLNTGWLASALAIMTAGSIAELVTHTGFMQAFAVVLPFVFLGKKIENQISAAKKRVIYLQILDEIRSGILENPRLAKFVMSPELLPENAKSCWNILTGPSLLKPKELAAE